MRWLCLTLGLLAGCGGLIGWIYLRDRDTAWRPPEEQTARADAMVADEILGGDCGSSCPARTVRQTGPHSWLVRVRLREQAVCLQIDTSTFLVSPRGLSGVQRRRCDAHLKSP